MEATDQTARRARRRRWHHRRDVRFLMVVGVLWGVYAGFGLVVGPSRISDRLHERLDQDPPRVNVLVTAKFPAEQFHMGKYQEFGSLRGTKGNTTALYRVRPADVRTLSRYYWIERIDLAD